jgi:GT2 family glycosyltransferase
MMRAISERGRHDERDVSITIVLFNSAQHIASCATGLRDALDGGSVEVVAVDNASSDEGVSVLSTVLPGARVLMNATNRGFAAAVNRTWPYVHGRYWLLLNPDVQLSADGLHALVEWMDEHPRCAAASPLVNDNAGESGRSPARALPSVWLVWLELLRLHRLFSHGRRERILQGSYWQGNDVVDAGWVPGAAMIVRREAVEQVGLLNEEFFLYGEDLEWCWRMHGAGWKIGACASVVVHHEGSASSIPVYGRTEALKLMVRNAHRVVELRRGRVHAWAYASSMAFLHWSESCHPRRSASHRKTAKALSRAWLAAARS